MYNLLKDKNGLRIFCIYQEDIDIIGNRKVPSYYQYIVRGKSKVGKISVRAKADGLKEAYLVITAK
jgi:hypothetical protein